MIHHGDCVEVMAELPENSVDAIVCDPPYGLEFMGKEWDRLWNKPEQNAEGRLGSDGVFRTKTTAFSQHYQTPTYQGGSKAQEWHHRWATAALRVAKPGAYLLAFGGTRTSHRLACAIEDAGWIIRDTLVWAYASGFPKGRANLKPAWEPIVMARKPGPLRPLAIDECRIPVDPNDPVNGAVWTSRPSDTGRLQHGFVVDGHRQEATAGTLGRWPANVILTDPIFDGDSDGVVGGGETSSGSGVRSPNGHADFQGVLRAPESGEWSGDTGTYSRFFLIPKAARSDREPNDPSYAYRLHRERGECVKLGAWDNADQSLAERMDSTSPGRAISEERTGTSSASSTSQSGNEPTAQSPTATRSTTSTATRRTTDSTTSSSLTPLPISDSTPAANSETESGGSPAPSADSSSLWGSLTGISVPKAGRSTEDAVPATSRSWSRRNNCGVCGKPLPRVSTHPTIKPVDLMRHLVRLVTPVGGVCLDPFLGSGTTAVACELEGFDWLGIEKEAEYVAIAEARLAGVQKGLGLTA